MSNEDITIELNTTDTFEVQLNEQGPQGATGPKGDKGDKGDKGEQGIQGIPGPANELIVGTVESGSYPEVTITGTSPNQTINFVLEKGEQGIQGLKGDTGNGIVSITKTSTSELVDTYTVTFDNGTTTTFTVTNGEKGDKGDTGEQGLKGDTGNGISSVTKTSTSGLVDTYTINYTDGNDTTFNVTNGTPADISSVTASINNNVGTPSVTVTKGGTSTDRTFDFAFENLKGIQGEQGIQGIQGPKGETGEQGPQGIQGIQGETGPQGISVTGVSLISTVGLDKTYRMTFSNGTHFDYVVSNGAAGSTEWGGISGILSNQTDLQNVLDGKQPAGDYTTKTYVDNADNNLQTQIDAITSQSDVTDIVGTYAELVDYDKQLYVGDIIKVLNDSTQSGARSYYRNTGGTQGSYTFTLIGSEAPSYTKSEEDTLLQAKQDVISDLSTIRSGSSLGTTSIQPSDNISELTNDSGYITGINSSDITTALGYTPYSSTNPNGYQTSSQVENAITSKGYQNASQVNTAVTSYHDSTKQDVISDLSTIRSGAEAGATAVQPATLNNYATNTALTNGLATKLDASIYNTNPRTSAVYLKTTYVNGNSCYRVWSDGFCEQWGLITYPTSASNSFQIALVKIMSNTDYKVFIHANCTSSVTTTTNVNFTDLNQTTGRVVRKNTSDFSIQTKGSPSGSYWAWYVCGYLASGQY